MQDAAGETWFVSLDARGNPEAATGAILVANKIFWTLGYWQVENQLATIHSENLVIGDNATVRMPSGDRRRMTGEDVDAVLRRAHRGADGSYRAVAGRGLPRVVSGFMYYGTRSDDPNDIVPHEHRRELRALKVFGAWTNLVDMKAGNTLDALVTENGRTVVRHYLQDVGSTFGTGANGPHDYFEGWEYLYEGDLALKRLVTLGFFMRPWQTARHIEHPSIGRFESEAFDPIAWKPRVPTSAFLHARADDTFWAARRVVAFSDEMVRAIVASGHYSDPAAARLLGDALIQRRDAIGRAYLTTLNPIVSPALDAGVLTFGNAAVDGGFAKPPATYHAAWFAFDNMTRESRLVGESSASAPRLTAPAGLPSGPGSFIRIELSARAGPSAWEAPVDVYFRRAPDGGWRLVGFERIPEG
jgi:hypothetical protein